jgi:hypothetical protein
MATYQTVAGTAVASAPQADPAPQILHAPDDNTDGRDTRDSGDIVDDDSGDPTQLSWWENRFLEIFQTLGRDIEEFPENPAQSISQIESDIPALIADETTHVGEVLDTFPQLQTIVPLVLASTAVIPGFAAGFAGLSGLAGIQPGPAPVAVAPIPDAVGAPVASGSPAVSVASSPGSAPSPAPHAAPAPAPASVAAGAPPPPAGGAGGAFPYLVGGPTIGSSTGMGTGAQRKAPEPDSAAAAAAAAASARQPDRARRRRAAMNDHHRGYRYEYVDPEWETDEEPGLDAAAAVASEHGAGPLGFAGTARREAARAAGLTTLAGDEFGGGPSVPMTPGTWEPFDNENDFQ